MPSIRFMGGIAILALLAGGGERAWAHHSFAAQYDRTKAYTITGSVIRLDWKNPHIYLFVNAKGLNGADAVWAVEGRSPNNLYRAGWRKNDLKVGETVTIDGWLARDGSNHLNLNVMRNAQGRPIFSGSAEGNAQGNQQGGRGDTQ